MKRSSPPSCFWSDFHENYFCRFCIHFWGLQLGIGDFKRIERIYLPICGLNQENEELLREWRLHDQNNFATDWHHPLFFLWRNLRRWWWLRNRAALSTLHTCVWRECCECWKASVYVQKRPCETRRQGAAAPRSNFFSRARGNADNGSEHEVAVWLNKSENCESALAGGGGGGGGGGVAVEHRFVPHSKESKMIFLRQGATWSEEPGSGVH